MNLQRKTILKNNSFLELNYFFLSGKKKKSDRDLTKNAKILKFTLGIRRKG